MVERRPAFGGRLQPAELALRARGHAHTRSGRPRGRARKATSASAPGRAAAVLAGGRGRRRVLFVWELQRPVSAGLGLRGVRRRFTGSYEAGSFAGNAFPSTSWVADRPRPLDETSYRLELGGLSPVRCACHWRSFRPATGSWRRSTAPVACTRGSAGAACGSYACSIGRPAARREPRARDLPHRLPLEFRAARRPRSAARHQRRSRGALARARRAGPAGGPGRRGFEWVKW